MLDRQKAPEINAMYDMSVKKPERRRMKNGMALNIIEAGTQEVVRLDVLIGAGQWHQTQSLQALFANRMLREGTISMTSAQIAEKLDYYGAWLELSSSPNCGFITLYSLNKYFPHTMAIIADMLMNPSYPEKELEVVLESNRQQFLVNSQRVEVISRKQFNRSLFGEDHPFGRFAVEEDYGRITPEVLREFYRKHYHSGNCSVYVSGKVTPEIVRCIERNLGDEPWGIIGKVAPLEYFEPKQTSEKRVFVEKPDALQSSLKMGCFVMDRIHPDFLKTRAMVTLFGGYFGSRLMSNIREDKGYTYGIGAGVVNCPGSGVLAITTEADNQYIEAIIREVYYEIDRLQNDLAPNDEVEMVRSYMLGDFCRAYEGPFSLSEAWIYTETAGLDDGFFERQIDSIRSVTSEEIRTLAQRYLCKEKLIEVVTGKKV